MYYIKTLLLAALLFTNGFSQITKEVLTDTLDTLFAETFFESTIGAVDIYNLSSDEILYQRHNKLLLLPASTMKVITTSTALEYLGPNYDFLTSFYYTGTIEDSTLKGDLYIVGGLDPDFTSHELDSLTALFPSLGIKKIEGNILGDVSMLDSLHWGSGWMWDDDPSTDAPYMSALNIDDNAVRIFVTPTEEGYAPDVNIEPESNYYSVINSAITSTSDDPDYEITRDVFGRTNTIYISGDFSIKHGKRFKELNIVNPAMFFVTRAKELCEKNGIGVEGLAGIQTLPDSANYLMTFRRPFSEVIVNLNKTSDNLSAEMTLRALGAYYFDLPTSAKNGTKMVDSLIVLMGLDPENYKIRDGSGVSRYNLVSAELLLAFVKYMYQHSQHFDVFKESLPIGGEDGTLKYRMENSSAFKNVYAKTGTLGGVSTLSGYVYAENGDVIAFSMMIQHFIGSSRTARSYQDKICEFLSQFE